MKKRMQILGSVATAIVSTGLVTNVSAEEVVKEVDKKETVTATETVTVTEADVTKAKVKLDTAKEEVTKQEAVVAQAQSEVDKSSQEVTQAQTQVVDATALVEKATVENIASAKADVTTAENAVSTATETLETKKEAVTQAEEKVANQKTVVSTTQSDVATKTQAVTDAQSEVATAQAILDGTGQAEVISKAESTAKKLDEDKKALTKAEEELVTAKASDAKRQLDIDQAENGLKQSTQAFNEKSKVASEATTKANDANTALKVAQEALKVAEHDVNSINTITLTPEYVEALRDYALNYTEKGTEAKATLKSLASVLRASNSFKGNISDSDVVYNVNALPENVRQELSLFASDLINQIRTQVGTEKTVVTASSIKFADLVSEGYVADNWSWNDVINIGHDAKAVNKAAAIFDLPVTNATEETEGVQYYENMNTYGYEKQSITISQAKSMIYGSILDFMFSDYEWLHAQSIAGLTAFGLEYLGVDISVRDGVTGLHFITIDDTYFANSKKGNFDKSKIVNPKSSDKLLEVYNQAKAQFEKATVANNQAQTDKTKAIESQLLAKAQFDKAQKAVTDAKSVLVLTPKAETKVANLKATVQTSKLENEQAQKALSNLKADVKTKQANLATAKQVLSQKQAILDDAKKQLVSEQAILSQLEKGLEDAQLVVSVAKTQLSTAENKLVDAKQYLLNLEEAPTRLEEAKGYYKQVTTALKEKQSILEKETEKLIGLKVVEQEATEKYETVFTAYQVVLEAERQKKLANQYDEIVRSGRKPVPVFDDKGKLVAYKVEKEVKKVIVEPVVAKKKQANATTNDKNNLPKTGTEASYLFSLTGIVGLFGLVLSRKKVK